MQDEGSVSGASSGASSPEPEEPFIPKFRVQFSDNVNKDGDSVKFTLQVSQVQLVGGGRDSVAGHCKTPCYVGVIVLLLRQFILVGKCPSICSFQQHSSGHIQMESQDSHGCSVIDYSVCGVSVMAYLYCL